MARLFVSYARRDQERIDVLAARLSGRGHAVLVDSHLLRGGDRWRDRLLEAIRSADAMIVALSPASVHSTEVLWEVDNARECGAPIVPVVVAAVESVGLLASGLAALHRLDLVGDPDRAFEDLVRAVTAIAGRLGLDPDAADASERAGLDDTLADPDLSTTEKMGRYLERYRRNLGATVSGRRQATLATLIARIDAQIDALYANSVTPAHGPFNPYVEAREQGLREAERGELRLLRQRRGELASELGTLGYESTLTRTDRASKAIDEFVRRTDRLLDRVTHRTKDEST
ncbi:MAG: toll/interleukin-1 receptor domain-containing protein [Vicinamibacterales bacterium]